MASNRFISTESLFEFNNVTNMLDCYTHLLQNRKAEEAYEVMAEIKTVILHLVIEKYMNQGEHEKSDYLNTAFTTELFRRHDPDSPPSSPILFEDEHKHGLVIHEEESKSVKVTVEKDDDNIDNDSSIEQIEEDEDNKSVSEPMKVIVEKTIEASKQSSATTAPLVELVKQTIIEEQKKSESSKPIIEEKSKSVEKQKEEKPQKEEVKEEVKEEQEETDEEESEEEGEEEGEEQDDEQGIELEEIMIKNKKYFIDTSTNNIYQCLEDDEPGDMVGKIQNGKFVRI